MAPGIGPWVHDGYSRFELFDSRPIQLALLLRHVPVAAVPGKMHC